MYDGGFIAGRCRRYRLLLEALTWLLRLSAMVNFATVPTEAANALWSAKAGRLGIAGSLDIDG
jgi:hypothetical protein